MALSESRNCCNKTRWSGGLPGQILRLYQRITEGKNEQTRENKYMAKGARQEYKAARSGLREKVGEETEESEIYREKQELNWRPRFK